MKRLDVHWLVALSALALTVPLAMGFMLLAKTGKSPEGWFYTVVPGGGLGIVGLLGSALLARFVIANNSAPVWSRVLLGGFWVIQFTAIILSTPVYLLAASRGEPGASTIHYLLQSGAEGFAVYLWYACVPIIAELAAPGMLVISGLRERHDFHLDQVIAAARAGTTGKTSTPDLILDRLRQGPAAVRELAEAAGVTPQTVRNNLERLKPRVEESAGLWKIVE